MNRVLDWLVARLGDRNARATALTEHGIAMLESRGDQAKALEYFERAAGLRAGRPSERAAVRVGVMKQQRGDLAGAADAFRYAGASYELAGVLREQGEIDEAMKACRAAIELGDDRASELLAELLDSCGEQDGAQAARSHEAVARMLLVALASTGHNYTHPRATRFAPYVVDLLRPGEQVERISWARMRAPGSPTGYLVLTDQRLLLLDDIFYPDTNPGVPDAGSHPLLPRYEFLALERAAITRCASVEDDTDRLRGEDVSLVVSFDERGSTVLTGDGDPMRTTEITVHIRNASAAPWLEALGFPEPPPGPVAAG